MWCVRVVYRIGRAYSDSQVTSRDSVVPCRLCINSHRVPPFQPDHSDVSIGVEQGGLNLHEVGWPLP